MSPQREEDPLVPPEERDALLARISDAATRELFRERIAARGGLRKSDLERFTAAIDHIALPTPQEIADKVIQERTPLEPTEPPFKRKES